MSDPTDLVWRLRDSSQKVAHEAADEIERLTNALAEEQAANSIADMAIERLTGLLAGYQQASIRASWEEQP